MAIIYFIKNSKCLINAIFAYQLGWILFGLGDRLLIKLQYIETLLTRNRHLFAIFRPKYKLRRYFDASYEIGRFPVVERKTAH